MNKLGDSATNSKRPPETLSSQKTYLTLKHVVCFCGRWVDWRHFFLDLHILFLFSKYQAGSYVNKKKCYQDTTVSYMIDYLKRLTSMSSDTTCPITKRVIIMRNSCDINNAFKNWNLSHFSSFVSRYIPYYCFS